MVRTYERLGILIALIWFLAPVAADAAILSVFPEREEATVGQSVRLEVGMDTEGERVNAVQAWLLLPAELELVGIETGGSLVDLWIEEPAFTDGMVRLTGGLTGGFAGRGLIGSIIVKPTQPGVFGATFDQSSAVLLHDGQGTSAALVREGTSFTVQAAPTLVVSSPSHPVDVWSAAQEATITWNAREDAVYSWSFDNIPETIPDTQAEESAPPLTVQGLGDGMHYFHLREGLSNENGSYTWGEIVHLRILVDTTAPKPYEPLQIAPDTIVIPARDESAGVEEIRYRASTPWLAGIGRWHTLSGAAPVPVPVTLRWFGGTLTVQALDGAGNAREHTIDVPGNTIAKIVWAMILLVILALIIRLIRSLFHKRGQSAV